MFIITLATQENIYEKVLSNIQEVMAREDHVIAIAHEGDKGITHLADESSHGAPTGRHSSWY